MIVTIIGLGSIGKRHLKTLYSLKDKIGKLDIRVFDTNQNRYNEIAEFDVIISKNIETSLEGSSIVFLCVPTSLHVEIYNKIKKQGNFHFFIEKPFSHTLDGCEEIIHNQKINDKKIVIGYMLRFHPVLKNVKAHLEKGTIGEVLSVRAESGFYLPLWHPWEDYRDFYMSSKLGGGGVLLDTSHEIDYLCWLFGNVNSVQGSFGKISKLDITSDDFASAILKFDNNIIAELHLDLLQPEESRYVKIIGTKGVMIGDLNNKIVKYNTIEDTSWKEEKIEVDFDLIYEEEMITFFNYIKNNEKKVFNENEALHVMEIIEAIRRSSTYGVKLTLPLYS